MAQAIKAQGHQVACFSLLQGLISERIQGAGIPCYSKASQLEKYAKPDAIIANHWPVVTQLAKVFPGVPLVSTIHGVCHLSDNGARALEYPALDSMVSSYVAVSEEVRAKLKQDYGINSHIIRNGLMLNRFSPIQVSAGKIPRYLLFNSNYTQPNSPELKVLEDVANHYGARLNKIGAYFKPSSETEKVIQRADIVFGMGRSVLEGVAMGRLGVVHGRWGTGGIVRPDTVEELGRTNYSGRNSGGVLWSADRLISEIDISYTRSNLNWGAAHVAANHDVHQAADRYLLLISSLR